MRTTLNLDDTLAAEVKAEAARTGTTMTALIEEGLRRVLAERTPSADGPARADVILAHGRAIAVTLREPWRSGDPADLLYDDRGLPA